MFGLIKYYFRPRYVVMKGLQIDNRRVMFIGAVQAFSKDDYGNSVMNFKNSPHRYYADKIYKRIWTFRQLMKWRRLLGSKTTVVKYELFRWKAM